MRDDEILRHIQPLGGIQCDALALSFAAGFDRLYSPTGSPMKTAVHRNVDWLPCAQKFDQLQCRFYRPIGTTINLPQVFRGTPGADIPVQADTINRDHTLRVNLNNRSPGAVRGYDLPPNADAPHRQETVRRQDRLVKGLCFPAARAPTIDRYVRIRGEKSLLRPRLRADDYALTVFRLRWCLHRFLRRHLHPHPSRSRAGRSTHQISRLPQHLGLLFPPD